MTIVQMNRYLEARGYAVLKPGVVTFLDGSRWVAASNGWGLVAVPFGALEHVDVPALEDEQNKRVVAWLTVPDDGHGKPVQLGALRTFAGEPVYPVTTVCGCSGNRIPCPKCGGKKHYDRTCEDCDDTHRCTCYDCDEDGKTMCTKCDGDGRTTKWPDGYQQWRTGTVLGVPVNLPELARLLAHGPEVDVVACGMQTGSGRGLLLRSEVWMGLLMALKDPDPKAPVFEVEG